MSSTDDAMRSGAERPAWLRHLAHDLRSPLSPLQTGLSMLRSGRLSESQQSELLDAIVVTLGKTPVAPSPHSGRHEPAFTVPKGLVVLLAEDNEVNQELATAMLRRRGCEVVVAKDGREAVALWERERFDVVLMDVQMPEMDGLEASRRITGKWPAGERPRIVAMTANAMQGDREQCLAAGMDDYVTKPIRVDALVEALTRVSSRESR